jgi:phage tail sheath protein FI
MPFQLSPGVNVSEIDLTTVVPAVASTGGAIAGAFRWGPLNERVLISSEDELAATFGKPDNDTANDFFTAANFLAYGRNLRVVRVQDEDSALNATDESSPTGVLIKNDDDWEANYSGGQNTVASRFFAARYAGSLGNSIKVSVCASASAFTNTIVSGFTTSGTTIEYTDGSGGNLTAVAQVGSLVVANGEERQITALDAGTGEGTLNAAFTNNLQTSDTVVVNWEFASSFDAAPGTSAYAETKGGSNDELHIAVVDVDGQITGTKGTVFEAYSYVSKASDAKTEDGSSNYYVNVLNRQSRWIHWLDHKFGGGTIAATGDFNSGITGVELPYTSQLGGGVDGHGSAAAFGADEKLRGYGLFANAEEVDISLVLGSAADQTVANYLISIAESRKDCVVFLSPERADVVNNAGSESDDVVEFRNTLPSTSYAFLDGNWKYQYDKYNDIYRWVPMNGDVAGLVVRTDEARDPWWSPAGFNRGQIKNAVKLAFNPDKTDRDVLYKNGVNPVVTFPGEGTILFGDKTLLARPSAFDRINVRRLFIVLEKAIATAAKYSLFEFNDQFTRAQFRNLVEPFLRDVQGRRGIYDFRVVCDETNNTGEVIDRNEFVGDIYIKPAKSINFIQLNFVAVRTGVDFSEVVGQF